MADDMAVNKMEIVDEFELSETAYQASFKDTYYLSDDDEVAIIER